MRNAHIALQWPRPFDYSNSYTGEINVPAIGASDKVVTACGRALLDGGSIRDDAAGHNQTAKLVEVASSDCLDGSIELVRVDAGVDATKAAVIRHALEAPGFGSIIPSDHQCMSHSST